MRTKYYVVMATWDGIEDSYTEEYSGIHHVTIEAARTELLAAKTDINYATFYIDERGC